VASIIDFFSADLNNNFSGVHITPAAADHSSMSGETPVRPFDLFNRPSRRRHGCEGNTDLRPT
jgi:hypothetical protein